MEKHDLNWIKVDVDSMPEKLSRAYEDMVAARKRAAQLKESFEAEFIALARKGKSLPAEKTLLFGYRFGSLAVAATSAEPVKAKSDKPTFKF